jgi:hypothetical protein
VSVIVEAPTQETQWPPAPREPCVEEPGLLLTHTDHGLPCVRTGFGCNSLHCRSIQPHNPQPQESASSSRLRRLTPAMNECIFRRYIGVSAPRTGQPVSSPLNDVWHIRYQNGRRLLSTSHPPLLGHYFTPTAHRRVAGLRMCRCVRLPAQLLPAAGQARTAVGQVKGPVLRSSKEPT